ncbi:hypothetical protein TIFTF001_028038 [Ficus carica]|uniref:Secreted protein n=1 Tax=Ficus carica TaxID=3494 RepID=A0AA88DPJ0_FICCA|nr:hypothetical protein TIFTF001_028038 [Ficus carica]
MLAVPIVVAIASNLAVPVAASIAKDLDNQIISLPTLESRGLENHTVNRSPSISPVGDVVVVCCKAGSRTYLLREALGDGDGDGKALKIAQYLRLHLRLNLHPCRLLQWLLAATAIAGREDDNFDGRRCRDLPSDDDVRSNDDVVGAISGEVEIDLGFFNLGFCNLGSSSPRQSQTSEAAEQLKLAEPGHRHLPVARRSIDCEPHRRAGEIREVICSSLVVVAILRRRSSSSLSVVGEGMRW